MPADDLKSRDFHNILLIKLSALGDLVHTFPLLNKLHDRYPKARIDWLVAADFAELLAHNPAIANVIEFPRDEWLTPWRWAPYASAARLIARLRAAQYDLVLDLQGQLRSAIFAFTSGAQVRIGFEKPRKDVWKTLARQIPDEAKKHAWQGAREGSWLAYTHHITLPTLDLHPVERYLGVAPLLGLDDAAPDFFFPIPTEAITRIDALLDYYDVGKAKQLIVMAPGTNWDTKQWRRDGFAEVARHFLQKGFAVVLIGSHGEHALCEEVAKLAPGAIDLAGETTLSELAALIRRTTIAVTNDFRTIASCRRARPAGGQRLRPDRSGLGRAVPPHRRGLARRPALRAVLPARPGPLHARPRLHGGCQRRRDDRTRRGHRRQAAQPRQGSCAAGAAALADPDLRTRASRCTIIS